MTERKKDLLTLGLLLLIVVGCFNKMLFTDLIVRAPDITNEFIWNVRGFPDLPLKDIFNMNIKAGWDLFANGGGTEGGGTMSMQFLLYRSLFFWSIPVPQSIAWFMALHLFFGGAGVYLYCRVIGASRPAALLGGVIFAVAPEISSLINAGHVQKIATISFAPWAFYFFEKGFQKQRVIYPMAAAVILALQFFNMHWQIAFYTCLGIAVYGVGRSIGILASEGKQEKGLFTRLLLLNSVIGLFFLSTVSVSLLPLSDWSKDTTRGAQSGANQGKGGLNLEEAMSWSLPPEELATFVVPGMFGFSRQEGGYNGTNIDSYYWGRMFFTQTSDYMGLLPWLLLPLPLIFRRDRYTWLALAGLTLGILFSMGKYTGFYWVLYEHFPGINHFRVPKMMMFIPTLCLGVIAARGLDCLLDEAVRGARAFRRYLWGLLTLPLLLAAGALVAQNGANQLISQIFELISQPNRYEQGQELITQRWRNLIHETWIAAAVAAGTTGAIFILARVRQGALVVSGILLALYLADVSRVNAKFLLLQPVPGAVRNQKTATMEFLLRDPLIRQYRALPMNGADPMSYATNQIPVLFTSNPVQMQRWQDFLDNLVLSGPMADMMNLKYLVTTTEQYQQEKAGLGDKFQPVFQSPEGEVVLENRQVLPKAWLASSALYLQNPQQMLMLLRSPNFDPRQVALVETPPKLPLLLPNAGAQGGGKVELLTYTATHVEMKASTAVNALLVMGDKYYRGWRATVDGRDADVERVNYIQRGIYLPPGNHTVSLRYDPTPFKIGKTLTIASFALFCVMLVREVRQRRIGRE